MPANPVKLDEPRQCNHPGCSHVFEPKRGSPNANPGIQINEVFDHKREKHGELIPSTGDRQ